ncbi:hypothetical protein IJG78_02725 [Candidatus Saccharibacteria bacterium]|nr:hypothetical protein [Candidatus Saccharibacteria bacterium]MBR0416023.1 hypothetical protein [Candidatus Saccharibacteria bacterium]
MESSGGMTGFITALTTGITSDILWTEITKAAPFVITVFVVAVGYRILRRVINKGSKLKAGI